jgi:capsular exopolysaccharide synthesis family protein
MENSNKTNRNSTNYELIDIKEIALKYFRKWHWFLISIIVCFGIAYLYLKISNDKYDVQSTILLRKDENTKGLVDMSMLDGLGMFPSAKEVEDEIQVISSKSIVLQTIKSLGVENEYFVKTGLKYEELYPTSPLRLITPDSFNDTIKQRVELKLSKNDDGYKLKLLYNKETYNYKLTSINKAFKTVVGTFKFNQISPIDEESTYKFIIYPIQQLTENYCNSISVAAVNKKSNAIKISTVSTCRKKSIAFINKMVDIYNLDAVIDKNLIASNTAEFVKERLELIENELLDVELDVESYKRRNSLTDIKSEAEIYLKSASEYDKKLAEIETQINLVSYIQTYVKDSKNQYSLVPANLGIEDKSLLTFLQEYNKSLLDRMRMMRTTNAENPVIMQMEQQLMELRESIIISIRSIKDGLLIAKKDLIRKDAQFASKIKDVPTQERQYLEIMRQQAIKEKLFMFLLQKREENALTLASTTPSAKTIDSAFSSLSPVAPKRMMIFLLAIIIGFIIPIVIIYILDLFDDKINNSKELKRLIKVPYLGSIGVKQSDDIVVVNEGLTTPIVEMFRIIRTNLQFLLTGKENPVILVTSSISGEGKSFTSINLAMSLALMKKKVVLVGLDIRSPMIGNYLHLSKEKGVTMFISDGTMKIDEIIIPSELHEYLEVIPAGPVPPNPAELIMSSRLDDLFAELRKRYDYIVVDSAPIGLVSDTYLLNRLIDNSIFMTRQHYTPKEATELINEIAESQKLKGISVILNGTNEISGYGYGYGYGSKSNSDTKYIKKMNKYKKFV